MINYEVDPAVLQPFLPAYTELDLFNGKALVSMVGFMFTHTRVFGLQWPWHTHFPEVNLRLYVKHFDGAQLRRGVVFVSEIVPRRIISTMANLLYREHYAYAPMRHSTKVADDEISVQYQWKQSGYWNTIAATAATTLSPMQRGSEEEFIFEHYFGYSQYDPKTTIEYGVEHAAWQVYPVKNWSFDCKVGDTYGEQFVPFLQAQPSSVFMAKGSDILIRKPRFIRSDERKR